MSLADKICQGQQVIGIKHLVRNANDEDIDIWVGWHTHLKIVQASQRAKQADDPSIEAT